MATQDRVFGIVFYAPDGESVERLGVAISTFQREFADYTRMWDDFERVLQRNERKQFATEGGHSGERWVALSDRYAVAKRRRFGRRKILAATGKMREALTKSTSPHALREKTDRQFVYGTQGLGYPGIHQTGSIKVAGRPPKRRPVAWPDSINGEIANEVLRKHVNRSARTSGLNYTDSPSDVTGELMPGSAT